MTINFAALHRITFVSQSAADALAATTRAAATTTHHAPVPTGTDLIDAALATGHLVRARPDAEVAAIEGALRLGQTAPGNVRSFVGGGTFNTHYAKLSVDDMVVPGDPNRTVRAVRKPAAAQAMQEEFAWTIHRALGTNHLVPIAIRDATDAVNIELVPGRTLASAGIASGGQIERILAKGYAKDFPVMTRAEARRAATIDRELLAVVDHLVANGDRNGGNAIVVKRDGVVRFIDFGHMGQGENAHDPLRPSFHTIMRNPHGTQRLSDDTVAHVARTLPRDVLLDMHRRLVADNPPVRVARDGFNSRILDPAFGANVVARLDHLLASRSFSYT